MWDSILQTAVELGWIQWVAFITGLIYIALAAQNKISCWFFGILSAGFWTYAAFFQYQLARRHLHLVTGPFVQFYGFVFLQLRVALWNEIEAAVCAQAIGEPDFNRKIFSCRDI